MDELNKPHPFRIIILIILLLVVFVLIYSNNKNTEQRIEPIRVGLKWLHQGQFAGMYVAQEKGFYKKYNINPTLIERDKGSEPVVDQVSNGTLDVGIVSVGDFLYAVDKKRGVLAIGALFQYSPAAIVSLQDSKIFTPEDLVGKRVGIVKNDAPSKLFVSAVLEKSNIPEDKITYKVVGFDSTDALIRGDVDAISIYRSNDLFPIIQQKLPYNIILPERYGIDLYDDILITSRKFYSSNADTVLSFMEATREGWQEVVNNVPEAVRITLKYDNEKYHSQEREEYIINSTIPLMKPNDGEPFGKMTPGQWDYTYELFHNQGIVGIFDIHKYFIPTINSGLRD